VRHGAIVAEDLYFFGETVYRKVLLVIRIASGNEPPRTDSGSDKQHRQSGGHDQQ